MANLRLINYANNIILKEKITNNGSFQIYFSVDHPVNSESINFL